MSGILQPLLRPVLQPVLRSVLGPPMRGGGGDPLLEAILALFANGEEGALYYFTEDFAGLYQDAVGTTPVTAVGQPVGLMLDRRFGLARGPEEIDNWDFRNGGAGWNTGANVTVSTAGAKFDSTPGGGGAVATGLTLVPGAVYELIVSVEYVTAGAFRVYVGGTTTTFVGAGERRFLLAAGAGSATGVAASGTTTALITSVSLRELPGNHASQTTTTARPTLRSGPLRIDYDGVDDYLRTVFPDLGSAVTIAPSTPGVGDQILTGQTIAAGNWDDNVTSCATLVIDRALTGPGPALVTAFLNQQAGV